MKNMLAIGFEQANPVTGDISGNAEKILEARKRHYDCDLVVFPECFLTGYPLEDLALRAGFIGAVMSEIQRLSNIVRADDGPALLFGAPVAGAGLPHNAAVLVRKDGSISVAYKSELPNNDVFDEARTFEPGKDPKPLLLDGFKLGVMICEDMWHGRVARELAGELADILLVLNGSPFEAGKQSLRIAHARRAVRDTGLPLVYLNQVGGQDEVVFDGASFAYDGDGRDIASLPFSGEASFRLILTRRPEGGASLEWDAGPHNDIPALPHTPYPDTPAALYGACRLGLSDYIRKIGGPNVLIGLSGGLDSALVAAMAVDAIGAARVTGVLMPSPHTSPESTALALSLAERLGIRTVEIPIAGSMESAETFLSAARDTTPEAMDLARQNVQARLRGLALMTLSNAQGDIVLSTGNKSELSVGYATLYGDMNGGFNPLKDLYKTEVKKLALWRNGASLIPGGDAVCAKNVIPEEIITRPPTAELKAEQSDEAELGSYELLDAMLQGLIEDNLDAEAARRQAESRLGAPVSADYARKIAGMLRRSEFKRRQAAPGIKLTSRSFGKGWRYPIAGAASFDYQRRIA